MFLNHRSLINKRSVVYTSSTTDHREIYDATMGVSNSFVRFILVAHFSIKTVSLICLAASTLAEAGLATPV